MKKWTHLLSVAASTLAITASVAFAIASAQAPQGGPAAPATQGPGAPPPQAPPPGPQSQFADPANLPQLLRNYRPVTRQRLLNPEDRNWLMIRRTYNGWGYSPLDD